jgi:hypothetical protein
MILATITSETSVNFYEITWHNIPEDSHLPTFVTLKSTSYTDGIKILKVYIGKNRHN